MSPADKALFLTMCISIYISGQITVNAYNYSLSLDPGGRFKLQWSVNYTQQMVDFQLTARIARKSWFAVGFSDYGEVTSADLLVFWTDATGVHHVVDASTDERGVLYPDQSQDYHVTAVSLHVSQSQGHAKGSPKQNTPDDRHNVDFHRRLRDLLKSLKRSRRRLRNHFSKKGQGQGLRQGQGYSSDSDSVKVVLDFRRKFRTCDPKDYALDNGTTHILYMEDTLTGTTPLGHSVTSLSHGVQRTQILKPEVVQPSFPADTWTFEVRAPKITVPATETTYWWQTVLLPVMARQHHIIKYEGIIAEGSGDLVHHMEVFHCVTKEGASIPYFSRPGLGEGKPKGLGVCRHVIGAWAMGAQAMVYPEEAGVPVGGDGFSRYALLEIHYNNPTKREGVVDTSGIRFYVTSQLRQFEAGIMELGLEYTNKMAVPPGQARFPLTGYCVPGCTAKGLPPLGIRVFASQLHTHLTGRQVVTSHVTYGGDHVTELPDLNRDDHYSSHFQEIRRLEPPVAVMPGDALITTCYYDTRNRSKATVGGFSISDEMCVNYIHYYPRAELEVCKSSVETDALDTFFFLLNRLGGVSASPDQGYRVSYSSIEWTPVTVALLDQLYTLSPLAMQCNASDGSRLPGEWGHTPIPDLPTTVPSRSGDQDTLGC